MRDFAALKEKTGPMAEPLQDAGYFGRVLSRTARLRGRTAMTGDPMLHDEMKAAGLLAHRAAE
ncbi:MAG: hypothetical protein R3D52_10800 [Xanthobacteraceae bacterium]